MGMVRSAPNLEQEHLKVMQGHLVHVWRGGRPAQVELERTFAHHDLPLHLAQRQRLVIPHHLW
jgi:hypothetical protein